MWSQSQASGIMAWPYLFRRPRFNHYRLQVGSLSLREGQGVCCNIVLCTPKSWTLGAGHLWPDLSGSKASTPS